ncbi:histone-like nucleoid-structuring protein Lsr2, partial [Xanthomonas citri pv. citri]
MAQRVRVDLVDDVDGSPAEESVNFALDGVNYVIDLSAENASKLRDALSLWVDHA